MRIPDTQQKVMALPYAEMHSLSTGSRMRLYIEHGPLLDKPVAGGFNAYGLSAMATIQKHSDNFDSDRCQGFTTS